MKERTIFIICDELIEDFYSSDEEKSKRIQLFFDYLALREYEKKAWVIPQVYEKISKKVEGKDFLYTNWIKNSASLIGIPPEGTVEECDLLALFKILSINSKVLIVSNKYYGDDKFPDESVITLKGLNNFLNSKKDFLEELSKIKKPHFVPTLVVS